MTRPTQRDCRNEPSYPKHRTVVFVLMAPKLTVHGKRKRCVIEQPHETAICGEWRGTPAEEKK